MPSNTVYQLKNRPKKTKNNQIGQENESFWNSEPRTFVLPKWFIVIQKFSDTFYGVLIICGIYPAGTMQIRRKT